MIFRASLFIKRAYNIFFLTFTMFRHVKAGKHIEYMRQKLSKNMLMSLGRFKYRFIKFCMLIGSDFVHYEIKWMTKQGKCWREQL